MFWVALFIAVEFGGPVVLVRARAVAPVLAAVAVPEAAVDENHFAQSGKNQVGLAGQVGAMQAKSKSQRVRQPPHDHFRFGVFTAHPLHGLTPLGGGEIVHEGGGS